MRTEIVDGNVTLKERLRAGLVAILVGINPSPVSVAAGHYYQGRNGKRMWNRLSKFHLLKDLTPNREDEDAFAQGFGFADVVRRPTANAKGVSREEARRGALELADRLGKLRDRPLIIFVYAQAEKLAGMPLREHGFPTQILPGPYAANAEVILRMTQIASLLRAS